MTNEPISEDAWKHDALPGALEAIKTQWPWLSLAVRGDGCAARLVVKSDRFSGSVHVAPPGQGDVGVPRGSIDAATTMSGPVADARVHLREAIDVCDALDTAMAMLRGVRVRWVWWP